MAEGKNLSPQKIEKEKIIRQTEAAKERAEKEVQPVKEVSVEQAPASAEERGMGEKGKEGEIGASAAALAGVGPQISYQQREREKEIEKAMEEGLESAYLSMPLNKRREFKIAGERTAKEIRLLLEKTKVKVKKIIHLIRRWLSIIPGVNKFFLEQEAKIKADEIMKMRRKYYAETNKSK